MGIKIVPLVIILAIVSSFISVSYAATTLGNATYYTNYVPSACFGYKDQGTMIVALNPEIFQDSLCGSELKAICVAGDKNPNPCRTSDPIIVKIVNVCPPAICPKFSDIALSKEAFSILADPKIGNIGVNFVYGENSHVKH